MAARNAMRFLPLKRLCTPSLRLFVSEESLFQVSGSVFLHPTRNVFRGHFDAAHNCRGHGRGKKMGSPDRTGETVQVPGLMESFVYSQAKSVAVDGSRGRGRERERESGTCDELPSGKRGLQVCLLSIHRWFEGASASGDVTRKRLRRVRNCLHCSPCPAPVQYVYI